MKKIILESKIVNKGHYVPGKAPRVQRGRQRKVILKRTAQPSFLLNRTKKELHF